MQPSETRQLHTKFFVVRNYKTQVERPTRDEGESEGEDEDEDGWTNPCEEEPLSLGSFSREPPRSYNT